MPAGVAQGPVRVPGLLRGRPRGGMRAGPEQLRAARRRRSGRGVPVRLGRGLPAVPGVQPGGRRVSGPVRRAVVRAAPGLRGAQPPGAVRVQVRFRRQRAGRVVVRARRARVPGRRGLRAAPPVHRTGPMPESVRRRRGGRPVPGRQAVPGARSPGRVRVRRQLCANRVHVPPGRRLPGARGVRQLCVRRPVRERHVSRGRPVRRGRAPGRVQVLSGRLQCRFEVGMSER